MIDTIRVTLAQGPIKVTLAQGAGPFVVTLPPVPMVAALTLKGIQGDPGGVALAPQEWLVGEAIDQIIALPAAPSPAHRLFVNGLLQGQSAYHIDATTLTVPAGLVWPGASCNFNP